MRSFGRVLREARLASGYSQEALALDSDVDRSYVSLLERGVRQPTLFMIHSLAAVLSVKPHELVRRAEEVPPGPPPNRRAKRSRKR